MNMSGLTFHEATPLKHAALGAARIAAESGDAKKSEALMTRARAYNTIVRRKSTRNAPEIPLPDVKSVEPVSPLDGPFREIMAELARMGGLADWRVVGSADGDGKPFRAMIARQEGDKIEYAALPVKRPAKAKPKATAEPSTESKHVQATAIADLPDGVRELAKTAKSEGLLKTEWTPLGEIEWDSQRVRVFARTWGKNGVRYGIAA